MWSWLFRAWQIDFAPEFPRAVLNLLVVVVGALMAQWIAYAYQRRGKHMEFRFDGYQEAVKAFHRMSFAGWRYFIAISRVRALGIARRPKEETDAAIHDVYEKSEEFEEGYRGISDRMLVHSVLFSAPTQQHWSDMVTIFMRLKTERSLKKSRTQLSEAMEKWTLFQRGAAKEIPARFSEPVINIPEEEQSRKDTDDIINRLEE